MSSYNQVGGSIDPFTSNSQPNYITNQNAYQVRTNVEPRPEVQKPLGTSRFNPDQKYLIETPGVVDNRSPWIDFWGIIIGIIITVLLALLISVLFWPNTITRNEVVIVDRDDPINNQTGSSSNGDVVLRNGSMFTDQASCTLASNRIWNTECSCVNPFYGPECELESHTDSYNAIGNPNLDDLILNLSNEIPVDRLSFPLNTPTNNNNNNLCTSLCDNNTNCTGVIYNTAPGNNFGIGAPSNAKPTCQLITGSVCVLPGNNIPYSANEQSKLYMKNSFSPNFKDRVFVYVGEKPVRPWLEDSYSDSFGDNRGRTMFENQLIKFNWTPTNVINGTNGTNGTNGITGTNGTNGTNGSTGTNRTNGTNGSTGTGNRNNQFNPWYGVFSNESFEPNEGLLQQLININRNRNGSNNQPLTITGSNQEYILISPTSSDINIPASWRKLWGAFIPSNDSDNLNTIIERNNNFISPNNNTDTIQSTVTTNSNNTILRYRTSQNAPTENQTIETTYRHGSFDFESINRSVPTGKSEPERFAFTCSE